MPEFRGANAELRNSIDAFVRAELGRRGMINALVLRGPEASKRAFDTYRAARREAGLPAPGTDRFAYAALCYVGDTDEEGLRVGAKTLWFLNTSLKQAPQFSRLMPGRQPPEVTAQNYRTQPRPGSAQICSGVAAGLHQKSECHKR